MKDVEPKEHIKTITEKEGLPTGGILGPKVKIKESDMRRIARNIVHSLLPLDRELIETTYPQFFLKKSTNKTSE